MFNFYPLSPKTAYKRSMVLPGKTIEFYIKVMEIQFLNKMYEIYYISVLLIFTIGYKYYL